jgi:hypothetical protein
MKITLPQSCLQTAAPHCQTARLPPTPRLSRYHISGRFASENRTPLTVRNPDSLISRFWKIKRAENTLLSKINEIHSFPRFWENPNRRSPATPPYPQTPGVQNRTPHRLVDGSLLCNDQPRHVAACRPQPDRPIRGLVGPLPLVRQGPWILWIRL